MLAAGERKRVLGELAAWQVAQLCVMLGGQQPTVSQLNPYGQQSQAESDTLRAAKSRKFFAGLSMSLFGKDTYTEGLKPSG